LGSPLVGHRQTQTSKNNKKARVVVRVDPTPGLIDLLNCGFNGRVFEVSKATVSHKHQAEAGTSGFSTAPSLLFCVRVKCRACAFLLQKSFVFSLVLGYGT
jgi:hypothetical protein